VPRIADCGWLITGVPWNVPYPPGFVIVNVPPATSSGTSFFSRERVARSAIAFAMPSRFIVSALRITGTMRPLPSASSTAMPRLTNFRVTIESPRSSPLMYGKSFSVSTVARAMNARYVGLTP